MAAFDANFSHCTNFHVDKKHEIAIIIYNYIDQMDWLMATWQCGDMVKLWNALEFDY